MHLLDSCPSKFNGKKGFPVCARAPTLQPESDLNLGMMGLLEELFQTQTGMLRVYVSTEQFWSRLVSINVVNLY